MKRIKSILPKMLCFFFILTILCGGIYPLLVTGISQVLFPGKANGSIIEVKGEKYGSVLLAQQFTEDKYLWGRVMNIDTAAYKDEEGNGLMYAAPSNKSPASEEYREIIVKRTEKIRNAHPDQEDQPIPADLVTSSGSGLDPHISPIAAAYQIERIAKARNMDTKEVQKIIDRYTQKKFLGILGEETVNVLKVNLALDGILE